jgi:short-subunit dehydrogenase
MRWSNKYGPWAVVTGASDGIGQQVAVELAKRGLNLLLVARRLEVLERLAAELAPSQGVKVETIGADLSKPGDVDFVIASADALEVGLLAAVAGYGTSGDFIALDGPRELNMVDVNCRAVVALSHAFARRFAAQRRGGLILMSSLVGFQGVPRAATYAATKAFIQTFAEGLRIELAPLGVDVLAAAPGPVRSGFEARANMKMGMAVSPSTVAREILNALGQKGTVRPGILSRVLETSLSPLPRRVRARIMGLVMRGMTKHQDAKAALPA